MKHSFLKIVVFVFVVCCLAEACKNSKSIPSIVEEPSNYIINLYQFQNDSETKEQFGVGLKWCFSYLGATLEKGSWAKGIQWVEPNKIQVNIMALGFNANALEQLKVLIFKYKKSEEYIKTKGIDAGRFVVDVLNNPNHYYKIVDMPESFADFIAPYSFLDKAAGIRESGVGLGQRKIFLPKSSNNIHDLGFAAEEVKGSLVDKFKIKEKEVFDIMPNGQLRFGIYKENGKRVNGSDPKVSIAGKPAKCMWCHEVNILPGYLALTTLPGYYSPNQFDSIIGENSKVLTKYRKGLNTEVDFNDNTQHTELEKIYIRFMEPSAKRLAQELRISEEEIKAKLSDLKPHLHEEFKEMGWLYERDKVEKLMPFKTVSITKNAREKTHKEPNLLP